MSSPCLLLRNSLPVRQHLRYEKNFALRWVTNILQGIFKKRGLPIVRESGSGTGKFLLVESGLGELNGATWCSRFSWSYICKCYWKTLQDPYLKAQVPLTTPPPPPTHTHTHIPGPNFNQFHPPQIDIFRRQNVGTLLIILCCITIH